MRGQTWRPVPVISGIRCAVGDGTVSAIHLEPVRVAPEELLVAGKIEVDAGRPAAQVMRAIDAAGQRRPLSSRSPARTTSSRTCVASRRPLDFGESGRVSRYAGPTFGERTQPGAATS